MRPIIKVIVLLAGVLLLSPSSYADGNQLLEQCAAAERFFDTHEPNEPLAVGLCVGYVSAVMHTMMVAEDSDQLKSCIPASISAQQAVRIVLAYLRKNPAQLHEHQTGLTVIAFMDAYTCE